MYHLFRLPRKQDICTLIRLPMPLCIMTGRNGLGSCLLNMAKTHYKSLQSKIRQLTTAPDEPVAGDMYYDTTLNRLYIYNGSAWKYAGFTTTTSTSTSTTSTSTSTSTTSTSTSTTSTSSSTTISTSTSISTSTTTTL